MRIIRVTKFACIKCSRYIIATYTDEGYSCKCENPNCNMYWSLKYLKL